MPSKKVCGRAKIAVPLPKSLDPMNELQKLLQAINSGSITSDVIDLLKTKTYDIPSWSKLVKDYDPAQHDIASDYISRKDRGNDKACRTTLALEKLLVSRMCQFMFAIPPRRVYHNVDGDKDKMAITHALEAIYKHARIDTENMSRAESFFAACEFFTIWYLVRSDNNLYGFPSKWKLKCRTYTPMEGTQLYPLFDDNLNLVAMSFEYTRQVAGKTYHFFETYTETQRFRFCSDNPDPVTNAPAKGSTWSLLGDPEPIVLCKIPGVYLHRRQCQPLWEGLQGLRQDTEYTISRNSDVIAYNSAPILKVVGNRVGNEEKGEDYRLFEMDEGGDVEYVTWSQAQEAVNNHVNTNLRFFFMQAQMPDISFSTMANLGSIGYDARQTLLTDAHLKVGSESGEWIEGFEREANVIKAFLPIINPLWDTPEWRAKINGIEVEHIITPFIQGADKAKAEYLMECTAGKPIMSQREAIAELGHSNNAEETMRQINQEAEDAATASATSYI